MEVLIVSKTRMGKGHVCTGGITFPGLNSVRLLNRDGTYQTSATEFEINQFWDIEFETALEIIRPHTEDVLILSKRKISRAFNGYDWLIRQEQIRNRVWRGSARLLFDNTVRWTAKRNGYISKPNVPTVSTGFWVPDQDLTYQDNHYTYRSSGTVRQNFNLAYVGTQRPIDRITAGSIIRVSLAKWWKPDDIDDIELRCYLQLSGWYD